MADYGSGTMGTIDHILGSRDVTFKPGGNTAYFDKNPDDKGRIGNTEYYFQIDENTNKVEVKRKYGANIFDVKVGTYDKDGNFTCAGELSGGQHKAECNYFTSPEGSKETMKQATVVAKADLMQNGSTRTRGEGVNDAEATSEVNEIFKTNQAAEEALSELSPYQSLSGPKSRTEFPGAKGKEPLIYPLSLGSTQQDVLQFQMLEYVARGLTPQSGSGVGARPSTSQRDIIGSVMLPIPGGIQSTNAVTWDENKADAIKLGLGSFAEESIRGNVNKAAKGLVGQVQGNAAQIKDLVATRFAEIAVGAEQDTFLARATGAIMNPNMELLFSAPTLRPFNFRFRLSPRSKDESKAVIQIIRFFQQGMAPRTDGDLLFLKSPHTFQLKYLYRGEGEHPFLNSFKECALQNLTINYTPENNYSTYEDGVMNSYEMQMQFQELQPVLNSDYDTGEGGAKGFPTNLNFADAQTSTTPGTTDYNKNSGYAPGYAPGDGNKGIP